MRSQTCHSELVRWESRSARFAPCGRRSTGSRGRARAQLDSQFQAILEDIDSIAANTSFGTCNPLNDDTLQIVLAVGITAGDTITVSGVDATATGVGAGGLDVATATGAGTSITALDTAIGNASALAAQFGIAENRLESRSRLLGVQIEATSAAESPVFAMWIMHSRARCSPETRSFRNRRSR